MLAHVKAEFFKISMYTYNVEYHSLLSRDYISMTIIFQMPLLIAKLQILNLILRYFKAFPIFD